MNQIKTNLFQNIVIILLSTVFFWLFMNAALAATFCASSVSQLQSNLTEAAGNGQDDTIQIVQGTYEGNFSYISSESNDLSVKGGYASGCSSRTIDPANTGLDGTNTDSSLILVSSQTTDFLVEGLTLQNGTASIEKGGGIYALTSGNVTMRNNILSNNTADSCGGGAFVDAASVTFEDNTISKNSGGGGSCGAGGSGAGLFVTSAITTTLTRNTITHNTAQSHGGGIFLDLFGSNPTVQLTDNTISNNSSSGAGGGLMAYGDTIVLTSNRFNSNSGSDGAGMWINGGDLTATGNTFSHNIASYNGGGMEISVEGFTLTNNIIHNNTATNYDGGGVDLTNVWTANLANNTIISNISGNDGGGVKLWLSDDPESAYFYNNIIMNNTAARGNELFINNDLDDNLISSAVDLLNNDFDQSSAGFYIYRPIPIDSSNLENADPRFVDQANGDYHLLRSSPCIDTGTSVGAPDTDIEGNSRPRGAGHDIGAYEYYEYVQSASIVPTLMILIGD